MLSGCAKSVQISQLHEGSGVSSPREGILIKGRIGKINPGDDEANGCSDDASLTPINFPAIIKP